MVTTDGVELSPKPPLTHHISTPPSSHVVSESGAREPGRIYPGFNSIFLNRETDCGCHRCSVLTEEALYGPRMALEVLVAHHKGIKACAL